MGKNISEYPLKSSLKHFFKSYVNQIFFAILLALFVRTFILTAYKVPTSSMIPTLKPGDFIFSFKPIYGLHAPGIGKIFLGQSPERGDVVVFSYPDRPTTTYVKRVVALEGDTVRIEDGKLIINEMTAQYSDADPGPLADLPGAAFLKLYTESINSSAHPIVRHTESASSKFGPIIVPPKSVFVLGDNRDASDDSRFWGTVPLDLVEGKVVTIWLSLDWQNRWAGGRLPHLRSNRTFSLVK